MVDNNDFDNIFWDEIETESGEKIPDILKQMLYLTGYESRLNLKSKKYTNIERIQYIRSKRRLNCCQDTKSF